MILLAEYLIVRLERIELLQRATRRQVDLSSEQDSFHVIAVAASHYFGTSKCLPWER